MLSCEYIEEVTSGYVELTSLPDALLSPTEMFIDVIENDTTPILDLDITIALTNLFENAYIANNNDTVVDI